MSADGKWLCNLHGMNGVCRISDFTISNAHIEAASRDWLHFGQPIQPTEASVYQQRPSKLILFNPRVQRKCTYSKKEHGGDSEPPTYLHKALPGSMRQRRLNVIYLPCI